MNKIKKEFEAVVLSNKMQKTIVVIIERLVKHEAVKKYHRLRKKFKVHDEKGECGIGDRVLIRESRPISKEKRWAVVKVLEKAAA